MKMKGHGEKSEAERNGNETQQGPFRTVGQGRWRSEFHTCSYVHSWQQVWRRYNLVECNRIPCVSVCTSFVTRHTLDATQVGRTGWQLRILEERSSCWLLSCAICRPWRSVATISLSSNLSKRSSQWLHKHPMRFYKYSDRKAHCAKGLRVKNDRGGSSCGKEWCKKE